MADSASQPPGIDVGMRVEVSGNLGYVRYVGQTSFATGRWVGVELDLPRGKNGGVVEGRRYFDCRALHGVFVRPPQARIVVEGVPTTGAQPEPAGRTVSRPTSISSRSQLPGSRTGVPTRPSSVRTSVASPTASTTPSRLMRPPAKRPGTDSTPDSPVSARRIRVAPQSARDDDASLAERSRSSTPPSSSNIQLQQQQQLLLQQQQLQLQRQQEAMIAEEENKRLAMEEELIQQELEQEEELAQKQQQQDQQGFAPPLASNSGVALPVQAQQGNAAQRTEAMVTLKEYEELRIKLRILETKRTEDRERIREAEKAKEESEQFLNIRTKLQAKLAEMQQELRDSKRSLKESVSEKEAIENKYNDVLDSMEVTLLDKEMAEERAENLQHEVNMLKEKVDEMANLGNPAVNQIQLERQNERLKEALLRLRDMTSEQEAEMTRKLKNLEKEASMVQEIEEMQSAIDDLEALKELNDELEENHSETEKQLQTEINMKDGQLRDQFKRIETLEENIGDYENTILQFRELVAHLQNDLELLRQKQESVNGGGLGSQSQAMLNLNLQLQSTAMKAQAKAIDLELRKLDALQANDNLLLVQPYLPDGFLRTENDSIQCFLLFKRLAFKAELMNKHLEQQYSISDKIAQNHIPMDLVPICEVRQKLAWFGDLAKRFVSYIEGCPVEVFVKMGQVYHDLVGTERRLNAWVELLRKEELKESDCVVDLHRAIAQLDHLADTFLTGTKLDLVDRYQGAARALDLNFDRVFINLSAIGTLFKTNEDGVRLVDTDDIQYQIVQSVANMCLQAKSGKVTTRKLLRKIDELTSQASVIKPECYAQYKNTCIASTKLGDFTHEARKRILEYARARREGVRTESIHQTIFGVTDSHLGINETGMWDGCRKMLTGLLQDISALAEGIMDPDISIKVAKPDKVWIKRAKDLKAEVVINLVKEAKLKDQALQESGVKIELLGKRMENFKKQAEQISILDRDVDKAKKQERDYDEAISALQADMATLEEQNAQLRRLVKKSESRSMTQPSKRPPHGPHGSNNSALDPDTASALAQEGAETGNNRDLMIQIESLKSALRFLRSENASLRTRAALLDLGLTTDLSGLSAPLSRASDAEESSTLPEGTTVRPEAQRRVKSADTELRAVALETKRLIKDARVVCASPKIVDLTKRSIGASKVAADGSAAATTTTTTRRPWQAQTSRPEWQYHTQQAALHTIQQRSNELKERLAKVSRAGVHPAPAKLKKLSLVETPIGRVHFPRGMSGLVGAPNSQQSLARKDLSVYLRSSAEFEAMHQLFVR
ncbi:hypothetical protein BGZ95_008925 [Linnemannia exigua]|uniref:CAP-Gly domain-containing protein n=1 Tax=Linnemannia exigua TaxID=604196 RepID=A0AAD4DDX7_9FUNG|nr:hypothetical protein BGZ95_008925 [Linnemannia exigua]